MQATRSVYLYNIIIVGDFNVLLLKILPLSTLFSQTVISHATHFYFDHPYEPDPEERGYYWAARYADVRKVFNYEPDDVYANIDVGYLGNELHRDDVCDRFSCTPLEEDTRHNIIGQYWSS